MEELTFECQHPDFSCTDAVAATPEEALQRVMSHNWDDEFSRFVDLLDGHQDCCPPGVFLRKPDGSYVHVYRTETDEFHLLLTVPVRTKVLGLIPLRRWPEISRKGSTVESLMPVVREYATSDNSDLLARLRRGSES